MHNTSQVRYWLSHLNIYIDYTIYNQIHRMYIYICIILLVRLSHSIKFKLSNPIVFSYLLLIGYRIWE